jgi:hypothetical protein
MIKSGSILIEYTIVIALIALIVTLSLRFKYFYDSTFVRAEVEKLRAICLYLQRKALLEHVQQQIYFDTKTQSYYTSQVNHRLMDDVIFGIIEGVKGPPSVPLYTISNSVTFKESKIIFYPDGTISAGTVYFTDKYKLYLYALTSGIAQVSYLRAYRFDKKWTLLA